ncbi:hypothetical protein FIBSPDRAFT_1041387 [Athelia psychrophila]|uniref:Uncharacterized protein n=1 Tax=Athelia psychrophila TaxID=1759441 RepID=A0A166NZV2_9AGAM|nr:hypothetical protein FIBSPDRAFT_1041387 [Fibularhizoctonia sp. CBS 109695]
MKGFFEGATNVRMDGAAITYIQGDHIQVFPDEQIEPHQGTLPVPSVPSLSSRNHRISTWVQNLPEFTAVPVQSRYYYVAFSIDKYASLRTLEGDSRFSKSAAMRKLINGAPEQKFFGYLYQIGGKEEGSTSNHYQIFCLRKQHGPLPNMCVPVVQDGLHRERTVEPSSRLPSSWGHCCHSSMDILPVTIDASCLENADAIPAACPFLSEMEVKRHSKSIVHDLKESGRLAREAKRRSSGGDSSSRIDAGLSVRPPGTKLQKQSWALLTVKISFELDDKSASDIGSLGLDPSKLIQLQSDLVAEVINLGVHDFKGLVVS